MLLDERRKALIVLAKALERVSFEETDTALPKERIAKEFPRIAQQKNLCVHQGNLELRPLKVGVVFSGGPAAGGHNVVSGLFDLLKQGGSGFELIGFLDGPEGLVEGKYKTLSQADIDLVRNTGGFHLLRSGRTKIETKEQFEKVKKQAIKLELDGLVIVGGDDSNTNAALLAEYFLKEELDVCVVGIPKTIDNDLRNDQIAISFGFDTATKVYSEMISNLCIDAASSRKYTHFVKLMGRSASHIVLECALKTHPNLAFISEEVAKEGWTLHEVAEQIANMVIKRSETGKDYGVILIPEGLLEAISEDIEKTLPESFRNQVEIDRDEHGNVNLSHIATEQVLMELTKEILKSKEFKGKFSPISHFYGYEGRCAFPSLFDATYCYNLGYLAGHLIQRGHTGYIACLKNLLNDPSKWEPMAISLASLLDYEMRKGKEKAVIKKKLVELDDESFKAFSRQRDAWIIENDYQMVGPMQFSSALTDSFPSSLGFELASC